MIYISHVHEPTIASLSIVIAVEVTRDHIHTFTNTIAVLVAVVFTVPGVIVTVEVASNCVLTYTTFTCTEKIGEKQLEKMEYKLEWLVILYSSSLDGLKRLGISLYTWHTGLPARASFTKQTCCDQNLS